MSDTQLKLKYDKGALLKRRYEIKDILGVGGMGEVYIAVDKGAGYENVVIKRLLVDPDPDKIRDLLYSFEQEYHILSGLTHPHIPKVYDFFTENNDFFIAEEYIKGELLTNIIHGLLPTEAVKFTLQLCDVLEYLHKRNIVYRDIKPDNIILSDEGRLCLVDFGISRFYSPLKKDDTLAMGTPGYAPPESYNEVQTDERTDIYCMCVLLHQMLTETDPTKDPFKFTPPHILNKKVPKSLSNLVMKGLNLNIEKRFKNIQAFRDALFKTRDFHNKFKSYQKKISKREKFFSKEEPMWEFSSFRNPFHRTKPALIPLSLLVSLLLSVMGYFAFPGVRIYASFGIFILSMASFLVLWDINKDHFNKVFVYPSGLFYEGHEDNFSALWDDVYAIKLDMSRKYKEVTVVSLNGDFKFDENLKGWDQLMKEIMKRAKLHLRHDISERYPEMEIYEK